MRLWVPLLLLSTACRFSDVDVRWELDKDGDGVLVTEDCDDDDAQRFPGNPEVCDEIDNDCNDAVDDDPTDVVTWYRDEDKDGYGVSTDTLVACAQPEGYAAGTGDCDDDDETRNPGALDLNDDGIDQDCNGTDSTLCYTDDDHDGHGVDPAVFSPSGTCEAEDGFAETRDDCDDTDGTVFPGAPELCDGQVNDCGGTLPATEVDQDDDGYVPCEVVSTGWVGDGEVIGGDDCNDGDDTVFPEAPERCDGLVNACGQALPADELDDDDDTIVECTFAEGVNAGTWGNAEVPAVMGGGDCDDDASVTFPGAPERCDGYANACAALPAIEIDNDDDGVVECVFANGVTAQTWGNLESPLVVAGNDCDDTRATVFPGANPLCDGLVNACGTALGAEEIDNDTDGYVECTLHAGGWHGVAIEGGGDCDDTDLAIYPAAPALCDGKVNACGTSLGADEIDDDDDGVVECTFSEGVTSESWANVEAVPVLSGGDCNDQDVTISPISPQLCDGKANTCGTLPDDEIDDDDDGYVECDLEVDLMDWGNNELVAVIGGLDCDDQDSRTHPLALEVCDGKVNECGGSLPSGERDDDDDGYVECDFAFGVDASLWGNVEDPPVVGDGDCDDTDGTIAPNGPELCDGKANVCGGSLPSDEIDDDDDGYVECTFADGIDEHTWGNLEDPAIAGDADCDDADPFTRPGAPDRCDGVANSCGALPADEIDHDDDGYVECTFASGIDAHNWGNLEMVAVTGDQDCDDADGDTYPLAPEICDGIANACGDRVPDEEKDPDADGYSACSWDLPLWKGDPLVGGGDCAPDDGFVYPTAPDRCDGLVNDCDDWDAPGTPGAPGDDEIDHDDDGYVECTFADGVDENTWANAETPAIVGDGDCDDDEPRTYPLAPEWCDGEDNDCDESPDDVDADGIASFFDGATWTDLTAGMATANLTLDDAGTLTLCEGTYSTTQLHVQADVTIEGRYAREDTLLDGGDARQLVRIESGAGMVTLRRLTLKQGRDTTDHKGGAVYSGLTGADAVTLVVDDCVFEDNVDETGDASDIMAPLPPGGAALQLEDGELIVSDTLFSLNRGTRGGAVHLTAGSATFVDTTFSQNAAEQWGGAVYVVDGDLSFEGTIPVAVADAHFYQNVAPGGADGGGGAIAIGSGSIDATGILFHDNDTANFEGGAILVTTSAGSDPVTIDLTGSVFSLNTADDRGGAIACLRSCDIDAVDTLFDDNASDFGGAVYLRGTFACDTDSALVNNTASANNRGGAVYISGDTSEVRSTGCDWGTTAGGDDNANEDIDGTNIGRTFFDNDQTFCCTGAACPTSCL